MIGELGYDKINCFYDEGYIREMVELKEEDYELYGRTKLEDLEILLSVESKAGDWFGNVCGGDFAQARIEWKEIYLKKI